MRPAGKPKVGSFYGIFGKVCALSDRAGSPLPVGRVDFRTAASHNLFPKMLSQARQTAQRAGFFSISAILALMIFFINEGGRGLSGGNCSVPFEVWKCLRSSLNLSMTAPLMGKRLQCFLNAAIARIECPRYS